MTKGTKVLDEKQVAQKIRRIAFEVYENNYSEKKLFIAGIEGGGYHLAELIKNELDTISPIETSLLMIKLDKTSPTRGEIEIEGDINKLKNHVLLLVDDVQNTGRTFMYGVRPFLNIRVKKIEVAVLVNRDHVQFPVIPTYTGYELSTTMDDHIHVSLKKGEASVYLY